MVSRSEFEGLTGGFMSENWFAVLIMVFILCLGLGSALLANCFLLDEIC